MGRGDMGGYQTIIYDIRFSARTPQQYYITSANQVIVLRGNRPIVVAKVAATNRSNLPYVIYDDRQQIYIDRSGNLFADNGRNVGYLVRHGS